MHWLYLGIAILAEVLGSTALKSSEGLTKWPPTVLMLICYAITIYLGSLALKKISLGIAYAVWSAVGLLLIATFGYFFYQEQLNLKQGLGVAFILIGLVMVYVS